MKRTWKGNVDMLGFGNRKKKRLGSILQLIGAGVVLAGSIVEARNQKWLTGCDEESTQNIERLHDSMGEPTKKTFI